MRNKDPIEKFTTQQTLRRFLVGAVFALILTPLLFYIRYGEVSGLGWGTTIFLTLVCLLAAMGVFFSERRTYHTPIALKNDWLDHIGAFWLVACGLGPLCGWFMTESANLLTAENWQWLYGLRVFLGGVLPIITALPLTRYVRGKAAWIAAPLLIGITLLSISPAILPLYDLFESTKTSSVHLATPEKGGCQTLNGSPLLIDCNWENWGSLGETVEVTYLRHTRRVLKVTKY